MRKDSKGYARNSRHPAEVASDPSEEYWDKVDQSFGLYHGESEYGEHLARVFRLLGLRSRAAAPRDASLRRKENAMGMMKNYLLKLLQQCSEEQFGQDAIEWAIVSGFIHPTYDLDSDVRLIMTQYDRIIEAYRRNLAEDRPAEAA